MEYAKSLTNSAAASVIVFFTIGCSSLPKHDPNQSLMPTSDSATERSHTKDREAILAMVGEFDVTFNFKETVPLETGYQPTKAKEDQAKEVVVLVEDGEDRIVLQHLLLVGGSQVIKHWRQDWIYEASHRFTFSDELTWDYEEIPDALTKGAWTQCVYGVVDTPRYCGTGQWNHRYGNATWTSDRTWRPLPRRDYTIRDDYTALNVENRHTITPDGWTHEQDNTKVVRNLDQRSQSLVREFGFNHYRQTDSVDFSPAYSYWENTKDFWALVRDRWQTALETGQIMVDTTIDGEPIIGELFQLAEDYANNERSDIKESVEIIFDQRIQTESPRRLVDR